MVKNRSASQRKAQRLKEEKEKNNRLEQELAAARAALVSAKGAPKGTPAARTPASRPNPESATPAAIDTLPITSTSSTVAEAEEDDDDETQSSDSDDEDESGINNNNSDNQQDGVQAPIRELHPEELEEHELCTDERRAADGEFTDSVAGDILQGMVSAPAAMGANMTPS